MNEYLHIVSDPAHMLAEATFFFGELLVSATIGRWWVKRHDRKHHQ